MEKNSYKSQLQAIILVAYEGSSSELSKREPQHFCHVFMYRNKSSWGHTEGKKSDGVFFFSNHRWFCTFGEMSGRIYLCILLKLIWESTRLTQSLPIERLKFPARNIKYTQNAAVQFQRTASSDTFTHAPYGSKCVGKYGVAYRCEDDSDGSWKLGNAMSTTRT